MSDTIKLQDVTLPGSFLEHMKRERPFRVATRDLLQVAFDHGGYIAGGFGTIVGRHYLLKLPHQADLFDHIMRHLGDRRHGNERSIYKNVGRGDIDVWFPDAQSLGGFINDPRRLQMISSGIVVASPTVTGCALEHEVNEEVRVQVIQHFLMPMHQQLVRFDIYNAMVGLTDTTITFPEHWVELEEKRMLHVSNWASPWTINRFFKWQRVKGYQHVTPSVADHLIDEVFKAIEWGQTCAPSILNEPEPDKQLNKELRQNKLRKAVMLYPAGIQNLLKPVVMDLSGEQLLQLSSLFRCPSRYDHAMQEIRRRMPVA